MISVRTNVSLGERFKTLNILRVFDLHETMQLLVVIALEEVSMFELPEATVELA